MDNVNFVVENSNYVKINQNKIPDIINIIKNKNYIHWSDSDEYYNQMSEKEIILFAFVLESLNFCFWPCLKWKITYNDRQYTRSDALIYSLLKAAKLGSLKLEINELHNISENQFYSFLGENSIYPILMSERYESFRKTIDVIFNNNNFWNELFSIKTDLELEKYITNKFSNFKDSSMYKGKEIIFNKRCRLLIADLYYVSRTIKNNINNINSIKGCADYSLPRYFRELNLFEYSNSLAELVDNEIELENGSEYEIEIRAATLYVLEIIKNKLKEKGIIISSSKLDNILWQMSRQDRRSNSHHTISIYY